MKVINQQKNSIIEDLLYSEKVKRTFSAVTQEDSNIHMKMECSLVSIIINFIKKNLERNPLDNTNQY